MQKNAQNFVNPAFAEIYQGITARMPSITFYGVIITYAVTAALNVFFIPLPLYISIPAALALQFGRFAIVFMDFLNPTGVRTPWPPLIAAVATIVALTELGFSCQDIGFTGAKFWAVFLFGASVISFGYLLEVNFISKGAEAFGMGSRHRPQGVNSQVQQQAPQVQQPAQTYQAETRRYVFAPNGNGQHHHNGVSNQVEPRAQVMHLGSHARAGVTQPLYNATVTHVLRPGEKPCDQCGQVFKPRVEWGRFCCKDCKEKYHASQHNGQAFNPKRYHKKQA